MKIFKDVVGGDEMLSDTFQMTFDYEDAIIKVPSKNRPKDDLGNVDKVVVMLLEVEKLKKNKHQQEEKE